jgi:hypothetical protein
MGKLNVDAEGSALAANPRFVGALGRMKWGDFGDTSVQWVSFYVVGSGKWNYQDQFRYQG